MGSYAEKGKRLLPRLVDDLGHTEPDRVVYSIARSSDISQGFIDITTRAFADAVNKTAWWLHNTLGPDDSLSTIVYIGPHDLRYYLLMLASMKVGYKILLLSPKNSKEGAAACLDATKCRLWAHPSDQAQNPLLAQLLETRKIQVIEVPLCDDLLDAAGYKHYAYTKTFEEAAGDAFFVLHSSGTTGLPKTIPVTHGLVATQDAMSDLEPVKGQEDLIPWPNLFTKGARVYSPIMLGHATSAIANLLMPYFFGTHCILGPVDVEADMKLFASLADHGNIDIWFTLPKHINALAQDPSTLAKVAKSSLITTCGGPVSPESGATVNKQIRVFNMTGTSEGFMSSDLLVAREDFLYFAWHPKSGYEFREVQPGVYEHWIVRNPELALYQGIFYTFPNVQEVNIKDLYTRHPTKPNHWLYYGRNDDIIAMHDGIKIAPADLQAVIADHPAIKDCLIVGLGQASLAVLVELNQPLPQVPSAAKELISAMQRQVQKADSTTLQRGYLQGDCIILADPQRPFARTDKLTVKRRETLALYEKDIEKFYHDQQRFYAPMGVV